jgi:ankyrin repeat protein
MTLSLSAGANVDLIETLIAAGADLSKKGTDHRTPLSAAAAGGHPDVLKRLLKAGVPRGRAELRDAMESAIIFDRVDNLHFLIASGGEVDARDTYGRTLLMQFCNSEGRDACLRALIDAGSDVNASDLKGNTALSIANAGHQWAHVEMLKKAGAVEGRATDRR